MLTLPTAALAAALAFGLPVTAAIAQSLGEPVLADPVSELDPANLPAAAAADTAPAPASEPATAALDAALVAGAAVVTADAQPLGIVSSVEAETVVLSKDKRQLSLPKAMFALNADGALMVLASLADIEAAIAERQAG